MNKLKEEKGFTLVEVVTVMAIMVITMGILAYGIGGFSTSTSKEKLNEINTSTKQAVTLYYNLYGEYPTTGVIVPGVASNKNYSSAETEAMLTLLDNYTNSKLLDKYSKSTKYKMKVNYPNNLILDITFELGN